MRVLLTGAGSLRGHRTPMLDLGMALRRRGHQVSWWSLDATSEVDMPCLDAGDHPSVADDLREMSASFDAFFARYPVPGA